MYTPMPKLSDVLIALQIGLSCSCIFADVMLTTFTSHAGKASTHTGFISSHRRTDIECARWCSSYHCCYAAQYSKTTQECQLLGRQHMRSLATNPLWTLMANQALGKKKDAYNT